MKRYIFEYITGTKGDLCCRFLNGNGERWDSAGSKRTVAPKIGCPNWLKTIYPKELTLDRFEDVISTNPYEYLPSHPLWVCYDKRYMDLLEKYNYEIISLKFEPKHYITIVIESIIKVNKSASEDNIISQINRSGGFNHKKFPNIDPSALSYEEKQKLFGIHHKWTVTLDEKRKLALESLEQGPSWLYKNKQSYFKLFNEMTENRTLVYYDELFCSDLPYPLKPDRKEEWLYLVDNSWCDYDENDYRKFTIPEDTTDYGGRNRLTRAVMDYLDENK